VQWLVKDIFGKEGHKGVNPDEVVAIGAAIQGAQILLGSQSKIQLLDVTPLSLGIETLGGRLTRLIERNATIPTDKTQIFSTASDNQTGVTISVYQGESEIARSPSNRLLGEFNLEGIRPAPRGEPQIEVTFSLDTNGILTVKAKDKDTGKEAKIEIKGSSGLDQAEVERMRKEAEAHAAEDRRKVELIEARNQADAVIFQIEKHLKELGDKIGAGDRQAINAAIERTKQAASGEDVQAIRQAVSDLQAAAQAMAQQAQHQPGAGPQAAPGGDGSEGKGKDDVIDAEFEVKK
jgi:molecular chaperone DnaK